MALCEVCGQQAGFGKMLCEDHARELSDAHGDAPVRHSLAEFRAVKRRTQAVEKIASEKRSEKAWGYGCPLVGCVISIVIALIAVSGMMGVAVTHGGIGDLPALATFGAVFVIGTLVLTVWQVVSNARRDVRAEAEKEVEEQEARRASKAAELEERRTERERDRWMFRRPCPLCGEPIPRTSRTCPVCLESLT